MPQAGTQRPLEGAFRRRRVRQLQARLAGEQDPTARKSLAAQIAYFEFRASPPRVPRPDK